MYSLIVLGLIPGTQIEISFATWLIVMAAVILVMIWLIIRPKHYILFLFTAWRLNATIRRLQLA
jgi:hypothetical protein